MRSEKFITFTATVSLLHLSEYELSECNDEQVQHRIEELEGDYYSFLHSDFINELVENGEINNEIYVLAGLIRKCIEAIPADLWNTHDFIHNYQWQKVRNMAESLLLQINQTKQN